MCSVLASLISDIQGFQFVLNFIMMPIFFFSAVSGEGAFSLRALAISDSLCVDGIRTLLSNTSHFSGVVDLGF